jgi:hypothetical protein
MAYVEPNYKTKKEFKEAVKAGVTHWPYSPGPFGVPQNGNITIEGPHYPQPHKWYADCVVKDGVIVSVK